MSTILSQNKLLQQLSDEEQRAVVKYSTTVEMQCGQVLSEEGENCGFVYLPLSGYISTVTSLQPHQSLEVSLIGNEGILGALVAVGQEISAVQAIVQGHGFALQIAHKTFRSELQHCVKLRQLAQQYLAFHVVQLTRLVCCNHYHETEPRLARALLLTHDKAGADQFFLTHQYLASTLGVRRSSVTKAAGSLLEKKIISYHRGQIYILNRLALEHASCSCYQDLINKQRCFLDDDLDLNSRFVR